MTADVSLSVKELAACGSSGSAVDVARCLGLLLDAELDLLRATITACRELAKLVADAGLATPATRWRVRMRDSSCGPWPTLGGCCHSARCSRRSRRCGDAHTGRPPRAGNPRIPVPTAESYDAGMLSHHDGSSSRATHARVVLTTACSPSGTARRCRRWLRRHAVRDSFLPDLSWTSWDHRLRTHMAGRGSSAADLERTASTFGKAAIRVKRRGLSDTRRSTKYLPSPSSGGSDTK